MGHGEAELEHADSAEKTVHRVLASLEPTETGVSAFCTTRDTDGKRVLLVFDDADRAYLLYRKPDQAPDAFAKAELTGWNCPMCETSPRDECGLEGPIHSK